MCQHERAILEFMPMIDTASTRPVKARITHAQIQRWQEAAAGFIEHGESPAGMHAYLAEQGCPPRLRDEVLRQARASVRGEHRGIGLRLFGLGLAGTGLGASMAYGGVNAHNGALVRIAIGVLILGVPPLFYGGWKLLTGSTAAPPER